ncbi:MAG: phosphodiester glycosidase family protein [Bacteroidales bacterium]|nr:phosphodiester glycosidase family protein [Bacteroidales bacterium]
MKTTILVFACALATIAGCSDKPSGEVYEKPLENPTKVTLTQRPFSNIVDVTWEDNSDKELGYVIWKRDGYQQTELATLDPNTTQYAITEGLDGGVKYNLGVQAKGPELALSSQIIYKNIELFDYSSLPHIVINEVLASTPTSVAVKYTIENFKSKYDIKRYGLCWNGANQSKSPTVEDGHQHGPNTKNGINITQAITSASIDHDKSYNVCGFVETEVGIYYSDPVSVQLAAEDAPITFNWTDITPSDFPSEVKVYKTTGQVNGRTVNSWYAIADVTTGKVEFRFEFGKFLTLEKWYSQGSKDEGNIVMTNAGYFNMTTHETGDFSANKGVITPCQYAGIPHGAFAVDRSQKPYAFWTAKGADGESYFFNEPVPYILNVTEYGTVKANYPSDNFIFEPYYAMCAGPLLVKDGKIMTDITKNGSDFVRNYEQIALDIFTNSSTTPDRTAVGYTKDGKIILYVCDGRIPSSKGASIVELAQIMLGLGCEGAVNFDGGGSTAMTLNGVRQNSLESNMNGGTENRSVGTVMGFYVVK